MTDRTREERVARILHALEHLRDLHEQTLVIIVELELERACLMQPPDAPRVPIRH